MRCPPSVSVSELREACDYLLVPFNARTVQCHNLRSFLHELSNEGARQQFTAFLEETILPQMIVSTEVNVLYCRKKLIKKHSYMSPDWKISFIYAHYKSRW